jgi:hypothetical protein
MTTPLLNSPPFRHVATLKMETLRHPGIATGLRMEGSTHKVVCA